MKPTHIRTVFFFGYHQQAHRGNTHERAQKKAEKKEKHGLLPHNQFPMGFFFLHGLLINPGLLNPGCDVYQRFFYKELWINLITKFDRGNGQNDHFLVF